MTLSSPEPVDPSSAVSRRFSEVRAAIDAACAAAGREPGSVTMIAVSKTQPPAALVAAMTTGQRVFGENRVQEARDHWAAGRSDGLDLELRLIGPLQTNKAMDALRLFDVIETLDRVRLVEALATGGERLGIAPRTLVQVNTGDEPQKAGIGPAGADALVRRARDLGLGVEGLMCIPPAGEDPAPHFAMLREIAARNGLHVLSMGMSGDFETAIRHGATHVRVGSALFGERNTLQKPSID